MAQGTGYRVYYALNGKTVGIVAARRWQINAEKRYLTGKSLLGRP